MNDVVPVTDWPETAGFWRAAAEHRLAILACSSCGRWLHLPRHFCASCGSDLVEWRSVSGAARLYAWTTVFTRHPWFESPFTILIVELEDAPGVRLAGRLPGEPQLEADMPMDVWFETLDGGVVIPQFAPRASEPPPG